jgi:hypothetical protein
MPDPGRCLQAYRPVRKPAACPAFRQIAEFSANMHAIFNLQALRAAATRAKTHLSPSRSAWQNEKVERQPYSSRFDARILRFMSL